MLEKILFALLICLINSEKIEVHFLDSSNKVEVNKPNFLLCIKMPEKLKQSDNFYLVFDCDEKNATITKTIYYNYLEKSCENDKYQEIDLNNFREEFNNNKSELNLEEDSQGIHHEYKIRKETNQNYILMLIKNFKGNQIKVEYSKLSLRVILVVIIFCVIGVIVTIIILVVLFSKYYVDKKQSETLEEFKTILVDDSLELKDKN